MKTLKSKLMALACAVFAIASLASCLNTSDSGSSYNAPSQTEKNQACALMTGSYAGKTYYYKGLSESKIDSATINFSITDTTLVIRNFPVSGLANYISNTSAKEIVAQAGTTIFRGMLHMYSASSLTSGSGNYYEFSMVPQYNVASSSAGYVYTTSVTFDATTTDAMGNEQTASHTLDINYSVSSYTSNGYIYSIAGFNSATKRFQGNVTITSAKLDGVEYSMPVAFGYYGIKN